MFGISLFIKSGNVEPGRSTMFGVSPYINTGEVVFRRSAMFSILPFIIGSKWAVSYPYLSIFYEYIARIMRNRY